MKGQWIGNYDGTDKGFYFINIDELKKSFSGLAFINSFDKEIPPIAISFLTPNKNNKFSFTTNSVACIDPSTYLIVNFEQIKDRYPLTSVPKKVTIKGSYDDDTIEVTAISDIDTKANIVIKKKDYVLKSDIDSKIISWSEFKRRMAKYSDREYIYRGQSNAYKLRTAFHRLRRYDLFRYMTEDIPSLHQHLCSLTKHLFNLNNPYECGAFYNLIQHHGYPTPLLDWTFSPFVAAFFGFRKVRKQESSKNNVRIYLFDQKQWIKDWFQTYSINTPHPHLSILKTLAIENQRMIPQQAISTFTNIDDIEFYIKTKEKELNKKYLFAFDIPYSERNKVMNELEYMGITAASLFPGLDGACEAFKEKNFIESNY